MKVCPITGSDGCMEAGCLFYQKTYTTEYMCIYEAQLSHLNELCQNMRLLVKSQEQHRETHTQFIKAGITRTASPELLRLTGLKESDGTH